MLGKIFQSLYNKIFINIVVERSRTIVYIESISKRGAVNSEEEIFETIDLNEKMLKYITDHIKESPYFYISILDTSATQGAIPTCDKQNLQGYYYDIDTAKYLCYKNRWAYYTSQDDLYSIERKYESVGIDFIFSPFVMVADFFKDKIEITMAMFIFVQDSYLSLTIFDNGELLFAEHLDMQTKDESDDIMLHDTLDEEDILLDDDDGIDLDELEVIDDDGDDFGSIEDLDALEDIDEFADSKDIEEEFIENAEEISTNSETTIQSVNEDESFTEDYQRFLLIQSSLGKYYKGSLYKSKFVENVYIADGIGVGADLKKYLEEEMFLNVYIRKLDIAVEVCELAKMELQE